MLDPMKDYVKNFSEINDLFDSKGEDSEKVLGFAKQLQQQFQTNKIKTDLKHALFAGMKKK